MDFNITMSNHSFAAIVSLLIFVNTVVIFALITKSVKESMILAHLQVIFKCLKYLISMMKTVKTDIDTKGLDRYLEKVTDEFKTGKQEVDIPEELRGLEPSSDTGKKVSDRMEDLFKTMSDDVRTDMEFLLLKLFEGKEKK